MILKLGKDKAPNLDIDLERVKSSFDAFLFFRDMPKLFYDIFSHQKEKIIYPIFRTIMMGAVFAGIFLLLGIFIALLLEVLEFMRNGIWGNVTLSDIFVIFNKTFSISYFDIPSWKRVEKILNWLFFEANAALSLFIFYVLVSFLNV